MTRPWYVELFDEDYLHYYFDFLSGRNHVTVTYILPAGERKTSEHHMRIYTLAELKRMLASAGLEVLETWGSVERIPYSLSS